MVVLPVCDYDMTEEKKFQDEENRVGEEALL
jgi:hypothetical protein